MKTDVDRGRLNVYLGELKAPWESFCKKHEAKPGPAIRQAVEKLLNFAPPTIGEVVAHEVEEGTERKKRIEVKLTPSERAAADKRAAAEGFASTNLWIAATVRAALTNMPQFGKFEIDALGQSNHELLAIGRNLNQIAKHLNASDGDLAGYDAELVQNLAAAIRKHVAKVGDALRASIYRWRLK